MNAITDVLKIVGIVALIALAFPLILTFLAYVGFFYGIIVSWVAAPVLATAGISAQAIPTIIAWLFVAGSVIGSAVSRKGASK